jgi:hypothetical protein
MTGSGISSVQPGNGTGIPGLATTAPTGSTGGASATITVGSGANDASALNIPVVTRNTIANDALAPQARIGSVFGDRSAPLPAGQVYRGGVPAPASGGASTEAPGERAGRIPGQGSVNGSPLPRGGAALSLSSDLGDPARTSADRAP